MYDKPVVVSQIFATCYMALAYKELGLTTPLLQQNPYYFLDEIAELRDHEGWRYFYGEPKCKADADDLGLVFQVLSTTGDSKLVNAYFSNFKEFKQACDHIDDDGRACTWLNHPNHRHDDRDYCVAVMANLYYGLLKLGELTGSVPVEKLQLGAHYIIGSLHDERGWLSFWYQNTYHDNWVVMRFLLAVRKYLSDELKDIVEQFRTRIVANPPVIYRSPQNLAWMVLTLKECGVPVPEAMIKFLEETQNPDGGWDAEDFYKTPYGKGVRFFKSRLLTSAFVARGLSCASVGQCPS